MEKKLMDARQRNNQMSLYKYHNMRANNATKLEMKTSKYRFSMVLHPKSCNVLQSGEEELRPEFIKFAVSFHGPEAPDVGIANPISPSFSASIL